MGTVETGTLSQLLLWSAKWLGDPSKGNTSQGTDGATLGLLSRLSGVPGQVAEVPLQPPITPMTPTTPTTLTTPTSREGISSHAFDQTPMILTSREETSNPTFGQVTACQVLLAALPARPSFNPEPSFSGGFAQPSSPCSGGARPSPCGTGRCPSPWGGACATACSSPCSQPQPGPGPMPQPLPVPMPQPMQPGNCGSGGCGQIPQPSRCQLGSGPQMGPLLGPIATTGCGASDRDMPTYGAPSNGWMPGNSWMTKPWPQQPAPMPMPMPEPMPSGNCGPGGCGQEREDCNSCGK